MEKSEHLTRLQEQTTVRKSLLERGKIQIIPERPAQEGTRQKGQEPKGDDDKQLPLVPVNRR
jgi:hypothetical protein